MKHKRMLTVVFSLILALTLSICSVFADNFSSPELPSDEELLTLVEDSVNAYKKQYIIHSVDIANKCIQSTSQNGYTVDFTVALDVELNYDSALQLPHVQGMLALLGIDASSTSTDVFLNKLDTDTLDVAISKIAQGQMSLSNSVSEKSAKIDVESAERITNTVKEELADFILELEDLYIGQREQINLILRATFDSNDSPVGVSAVAYDGTTYNIQEIEPASNAEMRANGKNQLNKFVSLAIAKENTSPNEINALANSEVYHRVSAREYANKWTSNPSGGAFKNILKWKIRDNPDATEEPYYPANNADCANYVSQAIHAGAIDKTSNDVNDKYHWFASEYGCSIAWENCESMYFYFTHNNYWTASDYANCNAGGIIFLKDTSGTRYHVVMCVQNNTVTRLYSAHTQDALKVPYTGKSSFGTSCNSLEYWVFTNSDTN